MVALAGVHPALADLSRTEIRRALKLYTRTLAYRKALVQGGSRYNLDGQPAREVAPDQQRFAKMPRVPKLPVAVDATESPMPLNSPPRLGPMRTLNKPC